MYVQVCMYVCMGGRIDVVYLLLLTYRGYDVQLNFHMY